jgi:predicted Zn-dependent protease
VDSAESEPGAVLKQAWSFSDRQLTAMQLLQSSPRTRLSKWQRRTIALALLTMIAGLVFAFEPLESFWKRWRGGRAVQRAADFSRAGDTPNAVLSLEIAAKLTTFDPVQLRVVAEVLRQAGSPQAVAVYRQLTELNPADLPLRETAIQTALRFGDIAAAEAVLANADPAKRNEPAYARLAADVAGAAGRSTELENALRALLARNGDDPRAKLELATLCLTHPAQAYSARESLRSLAASTATERMCARELLARDAARRNKPVEALRWSQLLAEDPQSTFVDRLFQLQLAHDFGSPSEDRLLVALQTTTASVPNEASTLATWMLLYRPAAEANKWLKSLPVAVRETPPIRRVNADVAVITHDWSSVADRLHVGAWGDVNPVAVDLALAAQRLRERGRNATATDVWNEAISAAGRDVCSLMALHRLSLAGAKATEIDATLRALARADPGQPWAARMLARRAHANRDTAALRDAYALWLELEPQNPRIQVEWALASLLLEQHVSPLLEGRIHDLYTRDATDPQFATVHAFCLWRNEHAYEAVQVLAQLSPTDLKTPGRALIYGAALASLGRDKEAAEYLQYVKPATLLPEEAAILREASHGTAKF